MRDIVERCGINRNSFYYHFQDIPSLLGEIIVERTNDLMAQCRRSTRSKRRSAQSWIMRRKTAARSCTSIIPSAVTRLRRAS
ncbi:MAG: TetR family transcriptional regulator [Oscillospiraceae bacterium]